MGHHFIYFVQKIRTHPVLKACGCLVHRILQHCRHCRVIQLYMIHLLHQLVDLSRKRKDQIPDTCDQFRDQHIDKRCHNGDQYDQCQDHSCTS